MALAHPSTGREPRRHVDDPGGDGGLGEVRAARVAEEAGNNAEALDFTGLVPGPDAKAT